MLDALGGPWPGPKLARPPDGSPFFDAAPARKERVGQVLHELQYGCVLWTVDFPRDWAHANDPDAVVEETLRQLPAARGGMVLMHDVHKQSIAALSTLVAALPQRNLTAATLERLWQEKYPQMVA